MDAFIRNDWYVAAWAEELSQKPLARTICDESLVLYRDANGKAVALQDRCCHRGAPLSMGEVTDKGLQCLYHGLVFDAAGKCVFIPNQDRIPAQACVRSYPLEERDGFVWIWMGDPARADVSLILRYPFHADTERWPHKRGMLRIKANFMLLIDNLMDVSHIAYVHRNTIGGGSVDEYAKVIVDSNPTDRGVKFTRWYLDHEPPQTYVKAVGFKGKVDRWQEFEFIAPSSVLQFTGAIDARTGAFDQGKREGGFALRMYHGVTPETDGSCLYFFSASNGFRPGDPAATELLFNEVLRTFKEDEAILEQQQAVLDRSPGQPLLDVASDKIRVQARRHVARRVALEATEATKPGAEQNRAVDAAAATR